jgi:hypothetical protein
MEWKNGITVTKDPDAALDYIFDFAASTNGTGKSDWLASGETIQSAVVAVESGLTKDSDSLTDSDTSVTIWLSGGTDGETYAVACKITTTSGRTDERTVNVFVSER